MGLELDLGLDLVLVLVLGLGLGLGMEGCGIWPQQFTMDTQHCLAAAPMAACMHPFPRTWV